MLLKKDSIITKIIYECDENILENVNNSLFVYCDDCSYSGEQLEGDIRDFGFDASLKYLKNTNYLFLVCPCMSTIAKEKLTKETKNVIFSNQTTLFDTLFINVKNHENIEVRDVVKKFEDKHLCTIYFDHKLADMISIFQNVYSLGTNISKKKRLEPLTLISGCEDIYRDVGEDVMIESQLMQDLQEVIGKEKMCPPPLYKLIKYKYDGKVVKKIKDLQ